MDLDEIWLYVARESHSIEIADRLIDSFTQRFELLSNHPLMGRGRDRDLGSGFRSFPVGQYVIVYRRQGGDVVILRVIQGNREIASLLSD